VPKCVCLYVCGSSKWPAEGKITIERREGARVNSVWAWSLALIPVRRAVGKFWIVDGISMAITRKPASKTNEHLAKKKQKQEKSGSLGRKRKEEAKEQKTRAKPGGQDDDACSASHSRSRARRCKNGALRAGSTGGARELRKAKPEKNENLAPSGGTGEQVQSRRALQGLGGFRSRAWCAECWAKADGNQ
jgi:hypothetical protein